jgi:hypothetical protein
VEQTEADGRAAAGHPGKLTDDVAGQDRLIDDVVAALEPQDATQMEIRDRVEDSPIGPGNRLLSAEWRTGMRDIIPEYVVRVGGEGGIDVMGILRGEVPVDEIQRRIDGRPAQLASPPFSGVETQDNPALTGGQG